MCCQGQAGSGTWIWNALCQACAGPGACHQAPLVSNFSCSQSSHEHPGNQPCAWREWSIIPTPPLTGQSGIDGMILMDRSVDIVSPACTQLTYEGLLEETMGIRCGQVVLESEGGRGRCGRSGDWGGGQGGDNAVTSGLSRFYTSMPCWAATQCTPQEVPGGEAAPLSDARGWLHALS